VELLSNLFGSLASGVIRLAVAVGIIAATYFFLVKPVLHTTDNAINKSFGPGGLGNIGRQIDHAVDSANRQVRRQVKRSFHQSKAGGDHDSQKLLRCVQRANGNVNRMQVCARRY
jgi:hypothetical protein